MTADGKQQAISADAPLLPKVFVSYSRKDTAFAEQLVADLTANSFEAFLDTNAIGPGEPWQERLGALITKADSIAFVVSPDSVDSRSVCDWELNEAERLQKRIIPVVCRSVPDADVPGRLRRLNYVFLTPDRSRSTELAKLIEGLKTDIRWIRQHTDLGEDAERWAHPVTGGDHVLLQGKAISEAELWISSRPANAPEPTERQRAFIRASREAEIARVAKEKRQINRTRLVQRALGVVLAAGVTSLVWGNIETMRREQAVFTQLAAQAMAEDHFDRAMRYALQATPPPGALPWAPVSTELEGRLAGAAMLSRMHVTLRGHAGPIRTAAFDKAGKRALTSSEDGTARVWDVRTGRQILVLQGHRAAVQSAWFSPDNARILTASSDHTARLWDAATGRVLAVLDAHSDEVNEALFSGDGRLIVTASNDKSARLWNGETGKEIGELKGHGDSVSIAAFNRDGTRVVTVTNPLSGKATAILWDVATLGNVDSFSEGSRLAAAAFHPRDNLIVLVGYFHGWLWTPGKPDGSKQLEGHFPDSHSPHSVAFSSDGKAFVSSATYDNALLYRDGDDKPVKLDGHTGPVNAVAFSPDGKFFVTASGDGTAMLWDANGARRRLIGSSGQTVIKGHTAPLRHIAIDSTAKQALTASDDGTARIWNLNLIHPLPRNSDELVANGLSEEDVKTLRERLTVTVPSPHLESITPSSFSPDRKRFATTGDETMRIWDTTSGAEIAAVKGFGTETNTAYWLNNGMQLAVHFSPENAAGLWDASLMTAYGDNLRRRVCREKLVGAQEFSDEELRSPILSSIDRADPVARNPCMRRGPLHWEYYAQAAIRWSRWVVSLFPNRNRK